MIISPCHADKVKVAKQAYDFPKKRNVKAGPPVDLSMAESNLNTV